MPRELSSAFQHLLRGQSPSRGRAQTRPCHCALPSTPGRCPGLGKAEGGCEPPAKTLLQTKLSVAMPSISCDLQHGGGWDEGASLMIMVSHKGPLRPTDEESHGILGPPRPRGIRLCPPRPGLPVDIREAQAGGAPRPCTKRPPPQRTTGLCDACRGTSREDPGLECLFSSETFDFAQGLTELSGPGRGSPTRRRALPEGSGATYRSRRAAGAAQTRAGSPARRSTGLARPSGIARPGLSESALRVATRGVPDHRRPCASGEKRGRGAEHKPQQNHPQAGPRVCAVGPRGARR